MRRWLTLKVTRFLLGLAVLASRLPSPLLEWFGRSLGLLAYGLAGRRRQIATTNLRLCLPHLSESARRAIVRDHFACYGRSFIERFIVWNESAERIQQLIRVEGIEHFNQLRGKPVILLAPHFLGLDAGGVRFQLETRFVSMYSKQSNPVLDEVTLRGRSRFNDPILISRQDGLRAAVRLLKSGIPFYFLPDMDLGPRDAVFAPFFGVPAATVTSVSRLCKMTGATVLPLVTTLEPRGYVLRIYPAWNTFQELDDLAAATYMNHFIEQRVLEAPAQYLWTHKRFKTRAPGEPSFYSQG